MFKRSAMIGLAAAAALTLTQSQNSAAQQVPSVSAGTDEDSITMTYIVRPTLQKINPVAAATSTSPAETNITFTVNAIEFNRDVCHLLTQLPLAFNNKSFAGIRDVISEKLPGSKWGKAIEVCKRNANALDAYRVVSDKLNTHLTAALAEENTACHKGEIEKKISLESGDNVKDMACSEATATVAGLRISMEANYDKYNLQILRNLTAQFPEGTSFTFR